MELTHVHIINANGLSLATFQKNIPYWPVKDVDFTSTKAKKRRIDNATDSSVAATSSSPSQSNRPVNVTVNQGS